MSDDERIVVMPPMSAAQAASWTALMDVQQMVPSGWTLLGGQLVHLHCAERGATPERPTDDVDAVLDVRTVPTMLDTFTRALAELGFEPDTSGDGLQHRWRLGQAQIDVLLPDGVGERAAARRGAKGAPTLETPGGSQALTRTEPVTVQVEGRVGIALRPTLVGALVIKAAAHTSVGDAGKGRHRRDFIVLAGLLSRRDIPSAMLRAKERHCLRSMVAACRADEQAMEIAYAKDNLARLVTALGSA